MQRHFSTAIVPGEDMIVHKPREKNVELRNLPILFPIAEIGYGSSVETAPGGPVVLEVPENCVDEMGFYKAHCILLKLDVPERFYLTALNLVSRKIRVHDQIFQTRRGGNYATPAFKWLAASISIAVGRACLTPCKIRTIRDCSPRSCPHL